MGRREAPSSPWVLPQSADTSSYHLCCFCRRALSRGDEGRTGSYVTVDLIARNRYHPFAVYTYHSSASQSQYVCMLKGKCGTESLRRVWCSTLSFLRLLWLLLLSPAIRVPASSSPRDSCRDEIAVLEHNAFSDLLSTNEHFCQSCRDTPR